MGAGGGRPLTGHCPSSHPKPPPAQWGLADVLRVALQLRFFRASLGFVPGPPTETPLSPGIGGQGRLLKLPLPESVQHGVDALGGADEADADHDLKDSAKGMRTKPVHGDDFLSGACGLGDPEPWDTDRCIGLPPGPGRAGRKIPWLGRRG